MGVMRSISLAAAVSNFTTIAIRVRVGPSTAVTVHAAKLFWSVPDGKREGLAQESRTSVTSNSICLLSNDVRLASIS